MNTDTRLANLTNQQCYAPGGRPYHKQTEVRAHLFRVACYAGVAEGSLLSSTVFSVADSGGMPFMAGRRPIDGGDILVRSSTESTPLQNFLI